MKQKDPTNPFQLRIEVQDSLTRAALPSPADDELVVRLKLRAEILAGLKNGSGKRSAELFNEAAARITFLTAEVENRKSINANLMGDDENLPRYTTKRLKQEVARQTETLTAEVERLTKERDELALRALAIDEALTNKIHLLTAANELLAAIVAAWEALPGGRQQSVRDVERWLAKDMAPVINSIRAALSQRLAGRVK